MSQKSLIYLFIAIGGGIGSYIPVVFGGSIFSPWSILGTTIGSFIGLYVAIKISN